MNDTSRLPYRLRLPGPTAVPARVRQAIAGLVIDHHGPEFHALVGEIQRRIRPIFGTRGKVLTFAGSGTAAMEAALANIAPPGTPVLVVAHGQFGVRFGQIAQALGCKVDMLEVEWGTAPDPAAIRQQLEHRDYAALCVTHNETSTGVTADLPAIGALTKDRPTLLLVDSVSGIAGLPVEQDRWHLDLVIGASQKALMCPPGIGLVGISAKAWAVIERGHGGRFFWDFRKAGAALDKLEGAFTPPVSLMAGLAEALRMIEEEGFANVLARHRRLAAAMRAGLASLGLPPFPREAPSDTVAVVRVPDGLDGNVMIQNLYERYRTVVAGSRTHLSGKLIRIGTMGYVSESDILTDLHFIELTLRNLGIAPREGAGVAAAAALFARPLEERRAAA
ncbi:MAG: alanine--glyoxylate aminotransferase family protein [Reyranella sp.]|uniref:pyridoxal-phosphate-dependent aminotransferase family protein n=1 Tax=Reyranella sp. TaxID=1929291 RepID=UPI003D12B20E